MDNLEEVLQSLNEFGQTPEKNLSPELEQLLEHIAKTGRTVFPWPLLKPLIRFKLEKVLTEFFESGSPSSAYISDPTTKSQDFLPTVEKLINNLNCFSGTPFTIQRICELITEPRKHYKTTDKFLRGVEKTILVVSTVQPDGSLITRSVGPHLTNGAVSPTESTTPINTTASPPSKPSHNSLLNTSFQENDAITDTPSTDEPEEKKIESLTDAITNAPSTDEAEEKKIKTNTADEGKLNSSPKVSASQNGHAEKECASDAKKPLDNTLDQKEIISEKSESLPEDVPTKEPMEILEKEKIDVAEEKSLDMVTPATEVTSKETTNIENEEKPAVEPTENKDVDKMDES